MSRAPRTPRPHPRAAPRRTSQPTSLGADALALAAVLLAGTGLRLWLAARTSGLTMDSPLYVAMAEALGRAAGPLGPAHHGYPALVALAGLVLPGRELPGRSVSLVAGVALIAITFALARRTLPRWGAATAAALVSLHPLLALFSGALMTEATFQAVAYAALLVLARGWVGPAGAVLGLGYCVRPEALVIAVATLPAIATWRRRALWPAAFSLAALPEVVLLSAEYQALTLTPKTNLIAASGAARDDAEWRIAGVDSAAAPARPLLDRVRETVPVAAARYPGRLLGQLERILQSWPLPLIALSMIGAARLRGPLMAPLGIVLVLPMLGVTPHLRYPQTLIPALAIFAAAGAVWLVVRFAARDASRRRAALALAALALVGGLAWCWWGPAGDAVRRFEDGPMPSLRRAGAWLASNGRPGGTVMDRKPYVPFFAGMRHVLMPDDDYDTIVEHARASGVDYLVVEEYVMWGMRRQFVPLMTDPGFRDRERRLRMVFAGDEGPMTGIAVFEVVRTR